MNTKNFFILFLCWFSLSLNAQLTNACKLKIGTNLGGLADYATELPFVDLMHNCRTWYSKDINNPNGSPFDSNNSSGLAYRSDGYPTHVPQTVSSSAFSQKVATIWANTDPWPAGQYTILYDGVGLLNFVGGFTDFTQVNANKITFTINSSLSNFVEMTIESSALANPIRNIRVLMPGTEATYITQPFNPVWINRLSIFKSVRFMSWGSINGWGENESSNWDSNIQRNWNDRQKMEHYTWANEKGIPYEMMVKLMNDYDLDGWVCVPHRTSNDFIQNMAQFFKDNVEPQRKLSVEYSNEIWNWMFGQTQWANKYGCLNQNVTWPEGIVPYIQNCMNIWTNVYGADLYKIRRIVALQVGWLDVSQRISYNMVQSSYDAVSPAYYFALSDETLEGQLDALGANATVTDVATRVVQSSNMHEKVWMQNVKSTISDFLNKPMVFYEGGQHITPTPFGVAPTYAQALLDIQRAPVMYQMYNDWYNFMRTFQTGNQPVELMNFAFIGDRNAQYGSWGILETMDQNTTLIPAPKYQSTLENQNTNCAALTINTEIIDNFLVSPNPTSGIITIHGNNIANIQNAAVYDILGKELLFADKNVSTDFSIDLSKCQRGFYFIKITSDGSIQTIKIIKE